MGQGEMGIRLTLYSTLCYCSDTCRGSYALHVWPLDLAARWRPLRCAGLGVVVRLYT